MEAILLFFVAHWALSIFGQTFFHHRYGAHRMFTMSPGWEKFFYVLAWIGQGSSYLVPRAYAIMHREHHAYSDTERDPHSPHVYQNFFRMMWKTKERYSGLVRRHITPEARFEGGYPEWPLLDRIADSWTSRLAFGTGYTLFYLAFAPHWAFFLLLPIHFLMGPVHGAIVNWGGHKYGYRNFATSDESKNTLIFDFLTGGELFQNNHHKWGMSPNFAVRWFEIDPTYQVMRVLGALGIIDMSGAQKPRWSRADLEQPAQTPAPPLVESASSSTAMRRRARRRPRRWWSRRPGSPTPSDGSRATVPFETSREIGEIGFPRDGSRFAARAEWLDGARARGRRRGASVDRPAPGRAGGPTRDRGRRRRCGRRDPRVRSARPARRRRHTAGLPDDEILALRVSPPSG